MQVAWHGHYCKYFELARCKLLDKIGYNYVAMAASDFSFPVVDMRIKYLNPAIFGQHVVVIATLVEWEIRLKIEYTIVDASNHQKLTSGYTIQAAVARSDGQLQLQTPKTFCEKVQALLSSEANEK
jgi:acyl-CoA thioester hydrolase